MRDSPKVDTLPPEESIRAQLDKILLSESFRESERLKQFLRFTVDLTLQGGACRIKEYLVAQEVFGREESFDPRNDPIVRVQAGKLRSRLEKYYTAQGREDPVLIEYPKGSYVPAFKLREAPAPAPPSLLKRWWKAVALASAVLGLAGWTIYWVGRNAQARQPASAPASIAVLPFLDMSESKHQEFLSDGITEEIINALAKLDGLRVVARTSAFEFKGRGQDIRKIGSQLNVATVLEGSVRRAGGALRVTAQLINVTDGCELWSETYDREIKDVFAIQEGIAQAVVNALRLKLTPNHNVPLVRRYTDNLDAYSLYLQGIYHSGMSSPEEQKTAIQCFEQVLALEPRHAPAWTALAVAYGRLGQRDGMPAPEARARGLLAAKKALEIDEGLGEAHAALAGLSSDLDRHGKEKEYQRALDLNPNSAGAHLSYGMSLVPSGRSDEGLRLIQRGFALDPLSPAAGQSLARAYMDRREFDKAEAQAWKLIERDPRDFLAYGFIGSSLVGRKRYSEGVAAYEKANHLSGRQPRILGALGYALGAMGAKSEAEKILRELEERSRQTYVSPRAFAEVCAGLDKREEALRWLERAYQEQNFMLSTIAVDFRYDSLRSDPRFKALLKKADLQ